MAIPNSAIVTIENLNADQFIIQNEKVILNPDNTLFQGEKGDKGEPGEKGERGEGLQIDVTFTSVAEMNVSGGGHPEGSIAIISTTDVNDPENSQLYVRTVDGWNFLNDLSGAVGLQGPAGKSAYQSWLDLGNVGTEADFIESLKGADGENGTSGDVVTVPLVHHTNLAGVYIGSMLDAEGLNSIDVPNTAFSQSSNTVQISFLRSLLSHFNDLEYREFLKFQRAMYDIENGTLSTQTVDVWKTGWDALDENAKENAAVVRDLGVFNMTKFNAEDGGFYTQSYTDYLTSLSQDIGIDSKVILQTIGIIFPGDAV